jgi:hypothetical protein
MKILQQHVTAKRKQLIKVHVDQPAVVKFMTPENYRRYKKGLTHRYWGGFTENPPAVFEVPQKGTFVAVVEKGAFNAYLDLKAHVEVCPPEFDYMNGVAQNETHAEMEVEYDDTLE